MECNDCIYFKRCVVLGVELDMHHNKDADKNCRHFKNKADFAEIVHGKWVDKMGTLDTVGGMRMTIVIGYKCSVCGHSEIEKYPFCNCGAKMDKEQG